MKRLRRLAAILPLLLASVAAAGDLDDAKALQKAGKFDEALPKYQAAAKADPTNADAALGLSQVLAGLGRYEEAVKAVDEARRAHPGNAALLVAKARACLLLSAQAENAEEPDAAVIDGYKLDAIRWAGEALKADPKSAEALVLRGQLHQREGNDEQTRIFFEEAVKADPQDFDANFALANYWFQKGASDGSNAEIWSKAGQYFAAAAKIDPKSGLAALNVAHCKAWQRAPAADVAAAYMRAAELLPDDETPIAKAYKWVPKGDRVATYQKLVDAVPRSMTRKFWLAYALSEDKQYDKALAVLGDASKLDPKSPFVPLNAGDVKLAAGKLDDAIDSYGEAMKLFDGKIDDKTFAKLGKTIGFDNKSLSNDQREKLWTLIWKNFPDRWTLANAAGLYYRDTVKDYKKSLEWYLRAAAVATDDACVQNDTGLIYHYHFNDFDKAEPFYRRAITIGKEQKYDWNASAPPGMGFRDALNNLAKILIAGKRWKDLRKFCEDDVPHEHALREVWLKQAEEKK